MQDAISLSKGDPASVLMNLASKNPQAGNAISILQACNGNYEQAVKTLLKQSGKNVNDLMAIYNTVVGQQK